MKTSWSVHRYLVTATQRDKWQLWSASAAVANWIEGRETPGQDPDEYETWLVTVMDEHSAHFLELVTDVGASAQEIDGGGDDEAYVIVAGDGPYWERPETASTER